MAQPLALPPTLTTFARFIDLSRDIRILVWEKGKLIHTIILLKVVNSQY